MDKSLLCQAIIAELKAELARQTEAALTSRDEATNEESKAEDKYDMRSQSAAYLAQGQAQLATEISKAINAYQNLILPTGGSRSMVTVGMLITLTGKRGATHYFLGPAHGGLEVPFEGKAITVITTASPLGRQLLGKVPGQIVELPGRPRPLLHTIATVE